MDGERKKDGWVLFGKPFVCVSTTTLYVYHEEDISLPLKCMHFLRFFAAVESPKSEGYGYERAFHKEHNLGSVSLGQNNVKK